MPVSSYQQSGTQYPSQTKKLHLASPCPGRLRSVIRQRIIRKRQSHSQILSFSYWDYCYKVGNQEEFSNDIRQPGD